MKHAEDNMEHLVSRSLDGMLSEEEQLELNRELIRCPEARRLMEASQEVDRLASQALRKSVAQSPFAMDFDALPAQTVQRQPRRAVWVWRLMPGAVAAAIMALVFARGPFGSEAGKTQPIAISPSAKNLIARSPTEQRLPQIVSAPDVRSASDAPMRTVGSNRPAVKRNVGRDVFGVVGEDGNLYWIEVDRSRTVRKADPQSRMEF